MDIFHASTGFCLSLEFSLACKILHDQFCSWHVPGNATASEDFRPITTMVFSSLAPGKISWRYVPICLSASMPINLSVLPRESLNSFVNGDGKEKEE